MQLANGKKCVVTIGNSDYGFDSLPVYITDLRKKFNWSKDIWTTIEQEKVKAGMNPVQVITSLGNPIKAIKGENNTETWQYETTYVYFSKGKVVKVKK